MLANLQGWHLIIILVVVLLLFGAPKLPALARSIGQSVRILKHETSDDDAAASATAAPAAQPAAPGKPGA